MKISVIIPIFKAEKYISECIESVLTQTYTNFELILINDGSPDNCEYICNKYARKDNRIKVLSQKNQGVSAARNNGITYSTGEWILFLDADDKLYSTCLETCIKEAIENNLDLLQFLHTQSKLYKENTYNKVLLFNSFTKQKYNVCIGGNFFKASIIKSNNIKFPQDIKLAEDQVFIIQTILKSCRFKILDTILYYYRITPNSATTIIKINEMYKSCYYLINFKQEHPEISFHIDNTLLYFLYSIATNSTTNKEFSRLYKNAQIKHYQWANNCCKIFYFTSLLNIKLATLVAVFYEQIKKILCKH